MFDATTPVVVPRFIKNPVHHGALGVARTLGRLGVPVFLSRQAGFDPVARSRYVRQALEWDFGAATPADTLDYLHGLAQHIGRRPILLPVDDVGTLFVAANQEALAGDFIFPRQPAGLPARLSSKADLRDLCLEVDVPTPETVVPHTRDDVVRFAREATFPVVLKAIDPLLLNRHANARSVVIAADAEDLLRHFDAMDTPGQPNFLLQEYIPGGAESIWMFNGYFDARSRCLFGITGQKIRQYAPYVGATSLGICAPNQTVLERTSRFLGAIGYRGIVDLGFRFDARDGQYKLLDVNPRVGATFRLFVDRGNLDVVRALYLDLTGQAVQAAGPRWGRRWLVEHDDLRGARTYRRDGRLTWQQYVRSLAGVEECAWFAPDDLAPFAATTATYLPALQSHLRRWIGLPPRLTPTPSAPAHPLV